MTTGQMELFASEIESTARPVYAITVCFRCGEPIEAVPIADPADTWQPAVLFGYIAQKAHERERHPERAA